MDEIIKIAIVDDDTLFTELLSQFINGQEHMEIVYTATNGDTFLKDYKTLTATILLLDLRMDDGSGLDVLKELKKEAAAIKTIVLSTFYRRSFLGQMMKLEANAFIPKDIEPEELVTVIETVHKKEHYFLKEQLEIMRLQLSKKVPEFTVESKDALTSRETDILKLLCQQFTTKEIGEQLFISPKTVETHKTNLLLKTGVKNTAGLVIYAIQNKIVSADDLLLLDR
ncbi:response regulator transcription factor [Kordia algicida OT-1]|uniref:Two-component response regulator n=1 Tax=Kordia algicida OT-1 TaxID=391587 RepID=A9DTV7_9FLAO|nr:response regulator transcription factor [Kordia algicida]EDP96232.1 two-component response regulator [Kordia algicida OT-1]